MGINEFFLLYRPIFPFPWPLCPFLNFELVEKFKFPTVEETEIETPDQGAGQVDYHTGREEE